MPRLTTSVLDPDCFTGETVPTIATGDGLILGAWTADHAPAVRAAFADPAIQRWHARSAQSDDEVLGWIVGWNAQWTERSDAHWAVMDSAQTLVGRVSLKYFDLDDGQAEVAYWTVPNARGNGVGPRAVRAVTAWAFDTVGFHRLELMHSVDNPASCRVADKAGFVLEGTKRSAALHADGWHDMHLHARIRAIGTYPGSCEIA